MKAHILLSAAICMQSIAYAVESVFLWPIPESVSSGQTKINLDPNFEIKGSYSSSVLDKAVERYKHIITHDRWVPIQVPMHVPASQEQKMQERDAQLRITVGDKVLESLEISVDDNAAELVQGVDESYVLDVPSDSNTATLKAATVWGAIRGLETFSQLVQASRNGPVRDVDNSEQREQKVVAKTHFNGLFIPETPIHIEDSPRFTHRGLMLDTSRNYFPVRDILRTLDAMAYNKMNVFHWHITDSQSFPLRLETVPELAEHGAYVVNGRRYVYTKKDVKRIVQYAKERGIRVVPEIDMPAHTGSWGLAFKELTTCTGRFFLDETNDWNGRYAAEPTTGQLNPVLDETYELVNKVISEIASMFPDGSFHGGGDEPIYKCWEDEPSVREYMNVHNATGEDLLNKFLTNEIQFIQKAGKQPILWEDSVTNNNLAIPKDVVLQVWVNPAQLAAKKGYKIIASHASFWYLDCGHGGWTGNDTSYDEQAPPELPPSLQRELRKHGLEENYRPSNWGGPGGDWCSPFKSWQRIYSYDMTFNLTETEANNVLGGEVAMWSEQMDHIGMDGRLWPRTAAAAEVMWSGRYDKHGTKRDVGEAMPRMFDWRYRLVRRGIQAEAIQPLWCGQNPYMCNSKYPASLLPKDGDAQSSTSKTDKANMTGAIHVEPLQTRSFTVSHDIYS